MRLDRPLLALIALAVALMLTTGTGGFGAVQADRGVGVRVVADDDAYLRFAEHTPTVAGNRSATVGLADLENRFSRELGTVAVEVYGDDETTLPALEGTSGPGSLGIGRTGSVTATVNCANNPGNPSTERWTVSITASGPGVAIALDRSVAVTCENSPSWNRTTNATADAASGP